MKIGSVRVKISVLQWAVFIIFTLFFIIAYVASSYDVIILAFGIPTLIILLIVPALLNYMSQRQYQSLVPLYEEEAKTVRIRAINPTMIGDPVRITGVVEKAYFELLNRPQYRVADRTGEISVKMFTSPQEDVHEGDVVEALGTVVKRYFMTGEPVINAVTIRKVEKGKKQA
jgi:hypothetical protein